MRPSIVLLFTGALTSAVPGRPAAGTRTMFRDPERKIEVKYDFVGDEVRFSTRLPAGWSFSIHIDGDQNGIWGYGPSPDIPSADASADHAFGRDQNGTF